MTTWGRSIASRTVSKLGLWPLVRRIQSLNEHVPHRGLTGEVAPFHAYCVYRLRNEAIVRRFVSQLPADVPVHLHAIDAQAPALAHLTRSIGPGLRMSLLQGLIDAHPPAAEAAVLVFDDDVDFRERGGAAFAQIASDAELDIAQPAHGWTSTRSFDFNRVAWLSTARLVDLVEVGPVVLFSPRAQSMVLPFPQDAGMGWGVDVRWAGLQHSGLRLGVVDCTPVIHHGDIGADYGMAAEQLRLAAHLAEVGVESVFDLARASGPVWRPWQRRAPWTSA